MKIKKSLEILFLMSLIFIICVGFVNALAVSLNSCNAGEKGDLDDTNVTGSSYCINVTYSGFTGGDSDGQAGENVTQCVYSAVGSKVSSITIGTNSSIIYNITHSGNSSTVIWDTTAVIDQNLTSVTVICTVNVTGTTITDTASRVIIDNSAPTSTYAGETPRDTASIDNDFIIIESAVDTTIVGCLLNMNKSTDATSTLTAFAPVGDKCTTKDLIATKNLADDSSYSYSLRTDDGLNSTTFATRTFTTNIRLSAKRPSVGEITIFTGGVNTTMIIGVIIFIILIGGAGYWYFYMKK